MVRIHNLKLNKICSELGKKTYHCCIICREVPKIVRRRLELGIDSPPLKQFAQPPIQVVSGIRARSYSSLATISASSLWIYSDDLGCPLIRERESIASCSLPFLTKYRGESGRNSRPPPRTKAQINWIAIGIRYTAVVERSLVAYTTIEANMMPIVMQNW